jgi:hypothetical protein
MARGRGVVRKLGLGAGLCCVFLSTTAGRTGDPDLPQATSAWRPTSTVGVTAFAGHLAFWTGSRMLVWPTGRLYDPSADVWTPVSTVGSPPAQFHMAGVWTGTKMIVWGGLSPGQVQQGTGGIYDPATDSWTPTSTVGAPLARERHTAVWTGSKMIVWGGYNTQVNSRLNTGGIYDPATDSWTPTSTVGAPSGRYDHSAVWTGTKMIVWGGYTENPRDNPTDSGAIYDPATDTWTPTRKDGAPLRRTNFTALWSGARMIIWGGFSDGSPLNTGGIYDPATDQWTPTSTVGAPSARHEHSAVWTGSEMIVWGGGGITAMTARLATGGIYDPVNDTWKPTSMTGAPAPRELHSAVWTGTEMIVWGGNNFTTLNTGGVLDPFFISGVSLVDDHVVEGLHVGVDVVLAEPAATAVTLDYTTVDGTAVAGSDYIAASGTLTIPAGASKGRILVQTYGDCLTEGDETFLVRVSNPSPSAPLLDNEASVMIFDEAPPTPVLSMPPDQVRAESSGVVPIALKIYPPTLCGPVSVQFATRDGSASFSRDYQTTSGTVTFPPGNTTQLVDINVIEDAAYEVEENFFLDLGNPSGVFLSIANAQIRIAVDFDAAFDADGIGRADLVVQRDSGTVGVLASTGSTFAPEAAWDGGHPNATHETYFADVNGGGLTDLVTRDRTTGDIGVRGSNGAAFARAPGAGPGEAWSTGWGSGYDVLFADVTGDQAADLIGRERATGDVWVLPAAGNVFGPALLWSYGWTSGYRLSAADVTGDGKADLVAQYIGPTAGATGDVYVAVSTGTQFVFNGRWTFGWSAGYELTMADADGDGKADLVGRYIGTTAGITGDVYVMRSTGTSFSWMGPAVRWSYGWGASYDVVVRDFSGDRRADLAGRLRSTGEVHVALSNGTRFVYHAVWATGVGTDAVLR